MKNLKKVISTLIALAISASSMVAFAANYPDVPETASYAQAVEELSALNVIGGYEDGTFLPDKNVTRAEITKMIITALGSATLNAANAAAGQDTKFADVPGSHWASGYVATAAASAASNNGFIDGYSDTEFGPEDNVTFAQATKMLVSALGYKTYAENNGGWPNGYLNYGYTLEIADGVSGVANDTQVTRAQVAQMIANAVKAPICVVEGYTTQWNGTQTPNFVVKDETSIEGVGKKNTWMCLLNYSHNAYVVNGRVTALNANGKADQVSINVEKANNYNGYAINAVSGPVAETAYIGASDAANCLFTYAEMLLQVNEDEEITILSIAPIGASSKIVEFAAEDVDSYDAAEIAVLKNETSTAVNRYELEDDAEMYVNGVKLVLAEGETIVDAMDDYIAGNATGVVTLVDETETGKTTVDGEYDYIMVTYFKDAIVESVVGDSEQATVYFSETAEGITSKLSLDFTDEAKSYGFVLADGTEIDVLDLQEGDIVSIAYDVVAGFANSDTYAVLVSRDTVEGKVTSFDDAEDEYTVNGEVYGLASITLDAISVGGEYVFCLDAFGKIAKVDATATSTKLAILDAVYTTNGDQHYARLILTDGSVETYTIKDEATKDAYYGKCYEDGSKKAIQERVYSYTVSSTTGNVTIKDQYEGEAVTDAEYNAAKGKIGSVKVSAALTAVVDAEEYPENGVVAMSVDSLEDGATYDAYGFNEVSKIHQFVIITDSTSSAVEFVVYSKSYLTEVDGDNKTAWLVYTNNGTEAVEVIFDEAPDTDLAGIVEGTPVLIERNSAGYVTNAAALFNTTILADYSAFSAAVRAGMKSATDDMSAVLNEAALANLVEEIRKEEHNWVFGVVVDKGTDEITLATAADVDAHGYVNVDDLETYDLADECGVMTYSFGLKKGLRVANTILSDVTKLSTPSVAFVDDNKEILDLGYEIYTDETATYGSTTYVLAKTVDEDIVELYAIVPSTTK